MIANRFTTKCTLFYIAIFLGLLAESQLLLRGIFPLTANILPFFILILILAQFRLLTHTNKVLANFIAGAAQDDFSVAWESHLSGQGFTELNRALHDVRSQLKEAARSQSQQAILLRACLAPADFPLAILNQEGSPVFENAAARGLLQTAKHRKIIQELMEKALRSGHKVSASSNNFTAQEANIIEIVPIRFQDKTLFIVHARNIQRELDANSCRAWDKLLRVLTHEIMNALTPITSLATTARALVADESNKERTCQALDTIVRRSGILGDFIQRYRGSISMNRVQPQPTGLATFLGNVIALYNHEKLSIHQEMIPAETTVSLDQTLTSQALLNLFKNAAEAEADLLKISCNIQNNQVFLWLEDNGCGINETNMEDIFVPFFSTKPQGSGIGLYLCKQIALRQGGDLNLMASQPGKTTFRMSFPLVQK